MIIDELLRRAFENDEISTPEWTVRMSQRFCFVVLCGRFRAPYFSCCSQSAHFTSLVKYVSTHPIKTEI